MPKTSSAPPGNYLARLQNAILRLNGCQSKYVEAVTVSVPLPSFHRNAVWHGEVALFEVYGHPKAQHAYAWSYATGSEAPRYVVVLEIPPVNSPQTAVQAAMAAQIVKGTLP